MLTEHVSQNQDRMVKVWKPRFPDSDEFALRADGLDELGTGARNERGEPEVPALPDLTRGECVDGCAREMRDQLGRRDHRFQQRSGLNEIR